ncbi:hypothetical protein N798_13995 [Knoellia flava TL1]|uniref:Uncharacterized protein n=2 Tax=Knoellia flava TaxID=913969 RepID=A0A8H9FVB7_9MICO|nr:hypothetical protein [Knoellia flava]KGN29421.1 hypothetical protein N798_13995 [Knoellia flava TL1]GGB86774.1 hypothetical protein GCM10011314_28230 [Knoellia flava]
MGDERIRVVPADMGSDATQWSAASESLGQAHRAVPALGVSFGGFQSVVGEKYSAADLAVQNMLELGASRLRATATNVTSNNAQTTGDDDDADSRVRTAAAAGGGGGSGGGSGGSAGTGGGGDHGGKGEGHYTDLLGPQQSTDPMPTDPKDPDITFDRTVDPETGEVSWSPRVMEPGEGRAVDGRDVERIPERADRIVVTMVDGEPRITYVDTDAEPRDGATWQSHGGRPVAFAEQVDLAQDPEARVVAGSGATEPTAQPARTEWSRALPEGADYAVVELRDGEPHLVFLDVDGKDVTQVADDRLPTGRVRPEPNGVQA